MLSRSLGLAPRLAVLVIVGLLITGCAHVSTVRLPDDAVDVGPGLRPMAAIQANAISGYFFFVGIPGDVNLDRVVNRMLIVAAKTMGADKVTNLTFDVTPDGGIWSLRRLLGWRSAEAKGIAVRIDAPNDLNADDGPEPVATGSSPQLR